eukprot:6313537-Amphidinium_carterae.1
MESQPFGRHSMTRFLPHGLATGCKVGVRHLQAEMENMLGSTGSDVTAACSRITSLTDCDGA